MAEIWEILTLNSNLFFRDLKIKSRNGGECGEWMWSMIWPSFWDLLSEFAKIALASFCTHWLSNCINNCKSFHSIYTAIWLSNMLNAINIVRKKQLTAYAMYISFSNLDFFLVDDTTQYNIFCNDYQFVGPPLIWYFWKSRMKYATLFSPKLLQKFQTN